MNKINPIFEALSGVDERHIPVTQEKRHAKKLKIMLIAAAMTAAIATLAGFTTSTVQKHLFNFYGEGVTEHSFEFNLTPYEITVPEEFMPKPNEYHFSDSTDIPPSELFEMFEIEFPINDNFIEVNDELSTFDVWILGDNTEVEFRYTLFNKSIDQNVIFNARYFSKTDNLTYTAREGLLPKEPSEVITLNDGSLCMITKSKAVFSCDGAHFRFEIDYDYEVPANVGEMTEDEQYQVVDEMIEAMPGMEAVKQVLKDLDLL